MMGWKGCGRKQSSTYSPIVCLKGVIKATKLPVKITKRGMQVMSSHQYYQAVMFWFTFVIVLMSKRIYVYTFPMLWNQKYGQCFSQRNWRKFSVAVILNFTLKPQHNITMYGISCMEFNLGEGQNKVHFPNYATVQIDISSHAAAASWLRYSLGVPHRSTPYKMFLSKHFMNK